MRKQSRRKLPNWAIGLIMIVILAVASYVAFTKQVPWGGGTEVTGIHEDVPPGVTLEDNEAGWRSALERLAALVEAR